LRLDYLTDWLSDLGLGIEEHGCVTFWKINKLTETLIGDLPVIVYHHTSTRILRKVKREGLRADVKKVNPYQNSGAGVYVTTEDSGPAVEGYHSRATQGHGGDEVTLGIKTFLRDLQPDPDDEDIASVGAVQFILPYVPPQDIFFPSQRPARKRTQKPSEREINLKPGLTLGPNVTSAAIEPGDVIAFDGPDGKNNSGKIISVNGDGKDKKFEIQLEHGKETVPLADLLKFGPLLGRGKMVHRVVAKRSKLLQPPELNNTKSGSLDTPVPFTFIHNEEDFCQAEFSPEDGVVYTATFARVMISKGHEIWEVTFELTDETLDRLGKPPGTGHEVTKQESLESVRRTFSTLTVIIHDFVTAHSDALLVMAARDAKQQKLYPRFLRQSVQQAVPSYYYPKQDSKGVYWFVPRSVTLQNLTAILGKQV